MTAIKIGRNDPCHCGSGNKYKKCHLPTDEAARSAELAAKAAAAAAAAAAEAENAEKDEATSGEAGFRNPQARSVPKPGSGGSGHAAPPLFRRRSV
ncbi:SEC-C metal-binding domain-containing protein [Pendulispora albinea]|uniref:SEC-C domain-containing protein n=1 Tax=Pendulispora albinea TaxID=2741071 RepID=A0ABZ2M8Q3_9BACT